MRSGGIGADNGRQFDDAVGPITIRDGLASSRPQTWCCGSFGPGGAADVAAARRDSDRLLAETSQERTRRGPQAKLRVRRVRHALMDGGDQIRVVKEFLRWGSECRECREDREHRERRQYRHSARRKRDELHKLRGMASSNGADFSITDITYATVSRITLCTLFIDAVYGEIKFRAYRRQRGRCSCTVCAAGNSFGETAVLRGAGSDGGDWIAPDDGPGVMSGRIAPARVAGVPYRQLPADSGHRGPDAQVTGRWQGLCGCGLTCREGEGFGVMRGEEVQISACGSAGPGTTICLRHAQQMVEVWKPGSSVF